MILITVWWLQKLGKDWHILGHTGCPETLVRIYHYSVLNNAEERSCQLVSPLVNWLINYLLVSWLFGVV